MATSADDVERLEFSINRLYWLLESVQARLAALEMTVQTLLPAGGQLPVPALTAQAAETAAVLELASEAAADLNCI